jgi:FkbM family methyltransferase
MKRILETSVNLLPYRLRDKIKQVPGIAHLQRLVVSHLLSARPFVHKIRGGPASGLRFEVTLPLDKAVWAGTYESEFTDAIIGKVKHGDVCYDIGGYRGYVSGAMALAGASNVFAFEPLPSNQQALRRLRELNPELPIELVPAAIGNADGSARLKVMADASMGKLTNSPFQTSAAFLSEIQIEIRRLDSLVENREVPVPNVIKVDVEGAELEVVLGGSFVLKTFRPIVFIETHSSELEAACSQALLRIGYMVRRLGNNASGEQQIRHLICLPA